MRAIRSQDTQPEMRVRKLAHSMGFRYALHVAKLPGKPDLVFVSRRKIIFVHGCFWHKHTCSSGTKSPLTNSSYWEEKRERNAQRDRKHLKALRADGWDVLILWECQTTDLNALAKKLQKFLGARAVLNRTESLKA